MFLFQILPILAFCHFSSATPKHHPPTVAIKNGTIIGKHVPTYAQDHFLGVPFAEPPLGKLRFNLPQPLHKSWNSPLSATEYGPICLNYPLPLPIDPKDISYPQSEDCLTINVVRPDNTSPHSKLPVLVYIFGGGFQEGGSADGRYNQSYLVSNSVAMGEPIIAVGFNYRLSGWGLLAGNDAQGQGVLNAFMHDQRLALRWIQENIAAFGGDPTKVTIQGESAGAASVGQHLLAYGGRDDGLFSGAICQSGGPWFFGTYPTPEEDQNTYEVLLNATNCKGALDRLSCLRDAPLETLNSTMASLSFLPIVDGSLIPEYNSVALAKGNFVKVPMLIGANTDEGKIFASTGVNSTAEFEAFIEAFAYLHTFDNNTIQNILAAYPVIGSNSTHGQSDDTISLPSSYGSQFLRQARYIGDALFIAGRRYTCELWAKHGLPCYSYRFDTAPADFDPVTLGATHFMEVAFAFDNVAGTGMDSSAFGVEPATRRRRYEELGELMSKMWVSFAATQSPNEHNVESFSSIWPAYSLDRPENMVFDGNTTSYVEADDWRKEALSMFIERAEAFSR